MNVLLLCCRDDDDDIIQWLVCVLEYCRRATVLSQQHDDGTVCKAVVSIMSRACVVKASV